MAREAGSKHPGGRIRETRLAAGLSLRELAALLGVPHVELGAWERGAKPVPRWREDEIVSRCAARDPRAWLVRVVEPRACWGFVIRDSRVVECAPYGRRRVGRTASSARSFLRSLPRTSWTVLPIFD